MAQKDANAVLAAEASITSDGTATYAVASSLNGRALSTEDATVVWAADASSILGVATLLFIPGKITITNFSRGPQIPVSAKPVTIPIIRVVPPAPLSPSFSITTPPVNTRLKGK